MTTHRTEVVPASRAENTALGILKAVFQPIDQGIVVLAEDRSFIFANKRACETLGVENEGHAADFVVRCCPDGIFAQSRDRKNAITYHDLSLPACKQRKLLGLEVHYLSMSLCTPCYLILIHDFSKWKRLDEMHSRFATSLSHRMRTPLTAVRNAVKLLSEKGESLPPGEKERLLDIEWRNIEKLIVNLDELQKVFMIESEEMNVCRTLIRVKKEIKSLLSELECSGKIRGFKMKVPDAAVLTGSGRLRDFISTTVDSYAKWAGYAPFIECRLAVREDVHGTGAAERRYKLSLIPRTSERSPAAGEGLRDFLSYREAHRGLILNRLATALDSEISISSGNYISLLLPVEPVFDREKDLVHPLNMMLERSELMGGDFHLVYMRLVGMVADWYRFKVLIERCLCTELSHNGIVSRGEEPLSYLIFLAGVSADDVVGSMRALQEHFVRYCRERGEEIYPSLRWEVRFSRTGGDGEMQPQSCILEGVL